MAVCAGKRFKGGLWAGVVVALVVNVAAGVFPVPRAAAQTVGDVAARDQLIANQENLLNTYRCRFGVDTHAVPGGCPNPDVVSPGVAPQTPTQHDVDVRDGLIQSQEALLNTYRCRFNIDTEVVPGGCDDEPAGPTTPTEPAVPDEPATDSDTDDEVAVGYRDVASYHPNADSIQRLRQAGVLANTDCADGRFCPDEPVDGKAFATWLVRVLDGQDSPDPIARLIEQGIAANCGDTRLGLCPDNAVPRNQMATFFARAFDLEEANPARLVDVASSNSHHQNISRLMGTTIDPGCGFPSRFCPAETVSRAQMANLLARAIDWQDERAKVSVTGLEDSINLTVAYNEEKHEATVRWSKPPARKGRVDHYIVQSRTILEDFGPKSYQIVEAKRSKASYRLAVSNSTNTNRLYAFRVIAVYANGKRLATGEVKTPSDRHKLRDVIWEIVESNQENQPWLVDVWAHINNSPGFGLGLRGASVTLHSEYPYPDGLKQTFVDSLSVNRGILRDQSIYYMSGLIEEMGHVYTLTNDINENPASIGVGYLYVHLLKINHVDGARNPSRCSSSELYGDLSHLVFWDKYSDFDYRGENLRNDYAASIDEWEACGLNIDPSTATRVNREVPEIAKSVFIDQEIPQWFYDTYQNPDEAIDLEKLWANITVDVSQKRAMSVIAYHLRNEFGGYCSEEQVRKFIEGKASGITNPWKDGGCQDDVVVVDDTPVFTDGLSGDGQTYDIGEMVRNGTYGSYTLASLQRLRNRPDRCWIAVYGYVLDVTPGEDGYDYPGPGLITDLCGQDASEHFASNNLDLPPIRHL